MFELHIIWNKFELTEFIRNEEKLIEIYNWGRGGYIIGGGLKVNILLY